MPMDSSYISELLRPYRVSLQFTEKAKQDFQSYHRDQQRLILAMLVKQGQRDPRLRPNGNGIPLYGELQGFAKIKSKSLSLRIVYRPLETEQETVMQVFAIGPRDHDEVYKRAIKRVRDVK